jgi:CRISPR/Cas system-associated exonuclease Cas4 (RecB family)
LVFEALLTRLLVSGQEGALESSRFLPILDKPGLPRALVRTLTEVRLAALESTGDPSIDAVLARYAPLLAEHGFADGAEILRAAAMAAPTHPLAVCPVLFVDMPLRHAREEALVGAVAARSPHVLFTVPRGDEQTLLRARRAIPNVFADDPSPGPSLREGERTALGRAQLHLFEDSPVSPCADESTLVLSSAPGESREAVEIVRQVLREAQGGVPFDQMAVALRSPEVYSAALKEAFDRAKVPAYFARGTKIPDPAGRAFLALLYCAEESLSARRFAEYLSLAQVPRPPEAGPAVGPAPVLPDDPDRLPSTLARLAAEGVPSERDLHDEAAGETPRVVSPRTWERLIMDAAVIGTLDRWKHRLAGLANRLDLVEAADDAVDERRRESLAREREALASLTAFALPLLGDLDGLARVRAPWTTWIARLSALAANALRDPARVVMLLCELSPLSDAIDVTLTEVRTVLSARLGELVQSSGTGRAGSVYIAPISLLRGERFGVVFVPGLSERMFPAKVAEDPILLDEGRRAASPELQTNDARSHEERLLFRVALGAAEARAFVSYPRLDLEHGRPRTPSYYLLELEKTARGAILGFDELALRATRTTGARVGWPAPERPEQAIDDAEHDLSLLRTVLDKSEAETVGTARYLLSANPHLARALRARGRRWLRTFSGADGLVDPAPEARALLAEHALGTRSFSPTALQNYAACPYRFFLYAVHKLAPRQEPEAIEEMGPLERGSLVHETQFLLLSRLREQGKLPITADSLPAARAELDRVLDEVAAKYKEDLFPIIDRVWEDSIQSIRADAREWLRRTSEDRDFTPAYFELSFGLEHNDERDTHSQNQPVQLECGIKLRGSIDLVEIGRADELRATDYKTGKQRATTTTIIGGGQTLQPVFYALALEKLFPGKRVRSGRLYYATSTGGFEAFEVHLTDEARRSANTVATAVGGALDEAFFPAAPEDRGCEYCDYKAICGPYEEVRAKRKQKGRLDGLRALRSLP